MAVQLRKKKGRGSPKKETRQAGMLVFYGNFGIMELGEKGKRIGGGQKLRGGPTVGEKEEAPIKTHDLARGRGRQGKRICRKGNLER